MISIHVTLDSSAVSRSRRASALALLACTTLIAAVAYAGTAQTFGAGEPLNATKMNQVLSPVGSVTAFAGPATPSLGATQGLPDGWLLCDGSAVSRSAYARIFAAIGTAHGAGDGSTTFNLPDLRGRFVRGVNSGGGGSDPETRLVGSTQLDGFKSHSHGGGNHGHGWFNRGSANMYVSAGSGDPSYRPIAVSSGQWRNPPGDGIEVSGPIIASEGGQETRPVNVAMNYIIRAK